MDVAADLALLLNHVGISRAELASKLEWSPSRLSLVLSGQENITLQTLAKVAAALGYSFDTVFREVNAAASPR